VLVHGVRAAEELAYRDELQALADQDAGLSYLPIATRETLPGMPQARLTTLVTDGGLERLAGLTLDPARSRIMLCGNPAMLADARKLLGARGFAPGRRGVPGNLAVENYW
jgi:ferredoxin--NADP+ reductase